jgi:ribosome maturation factor RimP
MSQQAKRVQALLEPVINAMGYECVGVEYLPQGKHSLLRIYIDKPEGIVVEDCEAVSHQVSGVLDVEDPIKGHYSLEVSSPGVDRPLFSLQHYLRFIGETVTLKMRTPIDGRRKFTGEIVSVVDEEIVIRDSDDEFRIPFAAIEKANLVPQWD